MGGIVLLTVLSHAYGECIVSGLYRHHRIFNFTFRQASLRLAPWLQTAGGKWHIFLKVRLHQVETMQWKPKWIFLDCLVKELKGVETKDRIYQMSGWLLFNVGCLSFAFVALRSLFERQVHSNVTEKRDRKEFWHGFSPDCLR